jgi:hypothetical protein
MNNTRTTFLNKKLPPVFGISFLILSIITISWISRNTILFGTKAAVGNIPKQIQISNITDTSFTVSFTTDELNIGTISYGTSQTLNQIGMDDRDKQTGTPMQYRAHHITIENLTPSTRYFFSIISNNATFLNNGQPYEVITGTQITNKNETQSPISGKVALDDGSIPAEALAYVSANDSQLLSVLIKPDGGYSIPLNELRKKDLLSLLSLSLNTPLQLLIVSPTMQSHVSLLTSQTNPVPLITLSKDYDFQISNLPLSPSPQASSSAPLANFPAIVDTTIASSPAIFSPEKEQTFKDTQPMFEGKALPSEDVHILIGSDQKIDVVVKADQYGNWKYRPPVALSPGKHTLTISSVDISGIIKTLTQPFTVFAQGSQFVETTGAPSPTVAPTIIPTLPLPTMTPILTPSPSLPQISFTPTPVSSISPTIPFTPTFSYIPSTPPVITNPPTPNTGSSSLLVGVVGAALTIGIGALLFVFTIL